MVGAVTFAALGATGLLPMQFSTAPVTLAGTAFPWWVPVLELGLVAAATAYVAGILGTRVLGARLASFVGLSEVLFAVLFAWALLGELPRPVQLLGGVAILGGVIVVRRESATLAPVEPGVDSAVEPDLPLGEPPRSDGPVVAHDPVEQDGVDVTPAQHERAVVAAVQHQGPRGALGLSDEVDRL